MNLSNWRLTPPIANVIASVGRLFGGERQREPEQDPKQAERPLDTDAEGNTLFQEDIIGFLKEELARRKTERAPLEQQWMLNANFLVGNQYCDINTYQGDIRQLEPVYDWLERETFNQIAPLIETRIANLKKINYRMKVNPRTNELEDYSKAEVSTAILQHTQSVSDFDTKKNTMIAWNELCGNCFWLSWWDKNKTPEGTEREEPPLGDLDYGLVTPYEIYPESVFKQTMEAQRSVILEQVKSAEDIYDLYGVETQGTSVQTFALTPMAGTTGRYTTTGTVMTVGHRSVEGAQKVVTYLERPSRRYPKGRMIILVGEDQLVYYGELPYSRIPIIQCVCREVPGQFFGKSVIEDLIPRQRAFNGCVNRIHEYIKRVAIQAYLTEEGSIDIEEYEENGQAPGAMLVYRQGSAPPVPIPNGALPSEIMTERYNLVRDMEYVAGVSQLTTSGAAPSGITSGVALEAIKATDDTRLSLTGDHIRTGIKNLARLWLEIYKTFVGPRRVVRYVGTNGLGSAMIWSARDINSFDVEYVTENELLLSEEMQKQRFFEAYNMGLFTDEQGRIPERVKQRALEYMKLGSYKEIMNLNLLQIQTAQRENVFFETGALPFVSEFDDHAIHVEEHLRYVLQMNFQVLKMKKPEYAKALEDHIRTHQQMAEQERMTGGGV